MPKMMYGEFYDELQQTETAEYYFNDISFDNLGRAVEVMQLRSALAQWAKNKKIKVVTRFSKETKTLKAQILK